MKELLARFPFIQQFAKFFVVGIMNTGVDLVVLNVLMYTTSQSQGVYYSFFKALSFLSAVIFSYYVNKHWTFQDKSQTDNDKKFYQFIGVSLVGAIINVTTATLVVSFVQPIFANIAINGQLWGNIGAICGTAVGLFWNFVGYKFWVFKK
jgi:putative flippase GtrA